MLWDTTKGEWKSGETVKQEGLEWAMRTIAGWLVREEEKQRAKGGCPDIRFVLTPWPGGWKASVVQWSEEVDDYVIFHAVHCLTVDLAVEELVKKLRQAAGW